MKRSHLISTVLSVALCCISCSFSDRFNATGEDDGKAIADEFAFNGYTNHWQNIYRQHYRYGNLYRINIPDLDKTITQSRRDLADKLGIPGLEMQEGFFFRLAGAPYMVLDNPTESELKAAFRKCDNVLVYADRDSETGMQLACKAPAAASLTGSYQTKADDFHTLDAFMLKNRKKTLFAVIGCRDDRETFKEALGYAEKVTGEYEMKRGWFGTGTNIQSVTCTPGTPVDVMGAGMNEGNSWFVFSGSYETHSGSKIADWVKETGLPVVTDLGASPLFGADDWEGFQSQLMGGRNSWLDLRAEKNGYLFKRVGPDKGERDYTDDKDYDGFFAAAGHEKQINTGDKPFVITTGNMLGGTLNSMVLFIPEGTSFDRQAMWDAIMDRRAVAIAEGGIVMGSDMFRKAVQLMMLDRICLEEYFGDRVDIEARTEGTRLHISITNLYDAGIEGRLSLSMSESMTLNGTHASAIRIPAGETKEITIDLNPAAEAMGRLNAIGVKFDWNGKSKAIMAKLDMPPAVSVHQLLYGASSGTYIPVSLYNFTNDENIGIKITVADKDDPSEVVFHEERNVNISKGSSKVLDFRVAAAPGDYTVTYEAMGVTAHTQLGTGEESGEVTLVETDIDGDGVNEYIMENSRVKVTLLTTGARVIEYIVKSKNDNVFFKLWPDKPYDVNRPFRERAFWPFGGFEDFLGQASVETHKVYDAEIVKAGGSYAEVKMTGRYYGNVIEKTFSLYGDTPLLGIRFALDMVNPELDVLGPQPILSIGEHHGTEDRFIIPEIGGNEEYVMKPDRMYGKILDLREGWNAGHDTKENISFVGAYPVNRPFYLHMWMNLDTNPDSHYPYVELQPWVPLYHGSTSYFSYYMWADGCSWEKGLKELRDRNLITERPK